MALDLSKIPVMPPPPGQVSNFIDPPSRGDQVVIVAILLPILSFLFVAARMTTRLWIQKETFWNDYFSVAALVFEIGTAATLIQRVVLGEGRHMWDVPLSNFEPYFLQYFTACAVLSACSSSLAKISICLFYLSIFRVNRLCRWTLYIIIFMVASLIPIALFGCIFACTPIEKSWNPSIPGYCIDDYAVELFSAIFNVSTDVAILVIPMPLVWSLNLPVRLKIGLTLVFITGGLICILSAVRLWATVGANGSSDLTWDIVPYDVASLFEFNFAIIVGCLPIIKPLIHRVAPFLLPGSLFGESRFESGRRPNKTASSKQHSGSTSFGAAATERPSFGVGSRKTRTTISSSARRRDDGAVEVELGSSSRRGTKTSAVVESMGRESREKLRDSWVEQGILRTVDIDATYDTHEV